MTAPREAACDSCRRFEALRVFVAGYLHGRSSLGNHDAAGREAEAAFNAWWNERERAAKELDL